MRFQQKPAVSEMQIRIVREFVDELCILLFRPVKVVCNKQRLRFAGALRHHGTGCSFGGRLLRLDQKRRESETVDQFLCPDSVFDQLAERFLGGSVSACAQLKHSQMIERDGAESNVLQNAKLLGRKQIL